MVSSIAINEADITNEDKILLHACRRYMAVTETDPLNFCKELIDLASQAIDHAGDDYEQALLSVND